MVICLERDADFHMAQLTRVVPEKGQLNGCVCVCVLVHCEERRILLVHMFV